MSHPASRTGLRRCADRGRQHATTGTRGTLRAAAVSAGAVAALMVGAAAPASAAPGADAWYRLRVCESGNNYQANTGNGYYGAYQFDLGTWQSVGGSGLPSNASSAEQDYRARLLYQERGWAPWGCARILGLTADPSYGQATAPAPAARATRSEHRRALPATTRRPAPISIAGPRTQRFGAVYQVAGSTRPNSTVVVFFRSPATRVFTPERVLRSDRQGRWSTPWRAVSDFQYFARGEATSRVATTTAAAPTTGDLIPPPVTRLSAGPAPVTVAGTARPDSALVVYVRAVGTTQFVAVARVGVGRTGRYLASFLPPAGWFDYVVQSSDGRLSELRHSTR